jgi:hypothetical protein
MKRSEMGSRSSPLHQGPRGPQIHRNFGVSTGLNRKLLPERHYE